MWDRPRRISGRELGGKETVIFLPGKSQRGVQNTIQEETLKIKKSKHNKKRKGGEGERVISRTIPISRKAGV